MKLEATRAVLSRRSGALDRPGHADLGRARLPSDRVITSYRSWLATRPTSPALRRGVERSTCGIIARALGSPHRAGSAVLNGYRRSAPAGDRSGRPWSMFGQRRHSRPSADDAIVCCFAGGREEGSSDGKLRASTQRSTVSVRRHRAPHSISGDVARSGTTCRRPRLLHGPDARLPTAPTPPGAALALAAALTDVHVGTWVYAAPMRPPWTTAWEAHSLSILTEGRFEMGIGAGRPGIEVELFDQGCRSLQRTNAWPRSARP